VTVIPTDLQPLLAEPHAPQMAFAFSRERWLAWTEPLDGVSAVVESLPGSVDRGTAARVVEELLPSNVAGAFTVTMIWGHGPSGYGPFRTARVLSGAKQPKGVGLSDAVVQRLAESAEIGRRDGAVEGYRFLNNRAGKIAGLGPAFFTKWLYFATARGDATGPAAAPVLDVLVMTWLRARGVHLRTGYTDDYAHYVDTLRAWGEPHDLAPAQVEERIFRLIRGDGA